MGSGYAGALFFCAALNFSNADSQTNLRVPHPLRLWFTQRVGSYDRTARLSSVPFHAFCMSPEVPYANGSVAFALRDVSAKRWRRNPRCAAAAIIAALS